MHKLKRCNMYMKFLSFILFICLISIGCKKEESWGPLDEYIKSSNLSSIVTKHRRGFYYQIMTPGTGATPTVSSTVTVFYKGSLTNGLVFDSTSTNPATFGLWQVIEGWQYGIPLIKSGGRIMLYLPPYLAYGDRPVGTIPPNSILIFDVTLQGVR